MKTEVIMHRGLQDFVIQQKSKTGMFNATDLVKQWNKVNPKNLKETKRFFLLKSTKELIKTIEEEEESLHGYNSTHVKSRASRGKNAGTWMHPILFIDFAMCLNPKFKYHVLKWVSDNLLVFRNQAGDDYKELTKSVSSIGVYDYVKVAQAINFIVYGKHQRNIRNASNESQLNEMNKIQSNIIFSIHSGFINNSDQLFDSLRMIYRKKLNAFNPSLI